MHFSETLIQHIGMTSLVQLLSTKMFSMTQDRRAWSLDSSSMFTYKYFAFLTCSPSIHNAALYESLWKVPTPSKVKGFFWIVALDRLNTNNLLQTGRPYRTLSPGVYVMCY